MVVNAAAAMEEQKVKHLLWTKLSAKESVWQFSPITAAQKGGLNRISDPDWVKLCVDPNGQIKLHTKQKCWILSATLALNYACLAELFSYIDSINKTNEFYIFIQVSKLIENFS